MQSIMRVVDYMRLRCINFYRATPC